MASPDRSFSMLTMNPCSPIIGMPGIGIAGIVIVFRHSCAPPKELRLQSLLTAHHWIVHLLLLPLLLCAQAVLSMSYCSLLPHHSSWPQTGSLPGSTSTAEAVTKCTCAPDSS